MSRELEGAERLPLAPSPSPPPPPLAASRAASGAARASAFAFARVSCPPPPHANGQRHSLPPRGAPRQNAREGESARRFGSDAFRVCECAHVTAQGMRRSRRRRRPSNAVQVRIWGRPESPARGLSRPSVGVAEPRSKSGFWQRAGGRALGVPHLGMRVWIRILGGREGWVRGRATEENSESDALEPGVSL